MRSIRSHNINIFFKIPNKDSNTIKENVIKYKNIKHNYVSFVSTTLFLMSETLPFIETQGNGILDTFKKLFTDFN